MRKYLFFTIITLSLHASASPTPFPVFLRLGFSSVLEFDETPTRVVMGDPQSFQVEKLDHSIVLKTLVPYATGNMFVYFKNQEPKLFVLTASEDAEPTYFRKFEPLVKPKPLTIAKPASYKKDIRLLSTLFDAKKDYLTVEIQISAASGEAIKPNWELVRLSNSGVPLTPSKLWSERKEVQKDTRVKARFIFAKPNIPRNLQGVSLIVPLLGSPTPFTLPIGKSR